MYYPKQIPYLLNQEFCANVEYREYHLPELEQFCMCVWEMRSKRILNKTIPNNILPDACIDLVIDFTKRTICFAGFSKETQDFPLSQKVDYIGVRFKPGVFYAIFGISADKIMDRETPFTDIEKSIVLGSILDLEKANDRINYLKVYLLQKINLEITLPCVENVEELYKNPKAEKVAEIAKRLGHNERQLYRMFKTYYGVSPKVLLNILRLHLCLSLLLGESHKLADIANLCGFYDQSHFVHEIRKYTGVSPLKLIAKYR